MVMMIVNKAGVFNFLRGARVIAAVSFVHDRVLCPATTNYNYNSDSERATLESGNQTRGTIGTY